MAENYGMVTTPIMSTVMSNPIGITQNLTQISTTRDMTLPMSSAMPINVTENTPNLEQIQSFPVTMRNPNGIHFHQDPVTGQMYRMTSEFHSRIPDILSSRNKSNSNNTRENNQLRNELIELSSQSSSEIADATSLFSTIIANSLPENINSFSQIVTTTEQSSFSPPRIQDYSQTTYKSGISVDVFNYNQNERFSLNTSTDRQTFIQTELFNRNNIVYSFDENGTRRPINRISRNFENTTSYNIEPQTVLKERPVNIIKNSTTTPQSFMIEQSENIQPDYFKKPMNRFGNFSKN